MNEPVSTMGKRPIRVVLIDDHELIRHGLRRAFEDDPRISVVGEADTVTAGLQLAEKAVPDVVILDVTIRGGAGLDIVRELRRQRADLGIVVLTTYAGDNQLFAALEAGASAFVAKDASLDEVVSATRHAAAAPAAFAAAMLADAMRRRLQRGPQLSVREHEVLRLLADGLSGSQIAQKLFISESTAKAHISRLYEKLGATNRAQALVAAMRGGLLE